MDSFRSVVRTSLELGALQHGVDPIRVLLFDEGGEVTLTVENQGPQIPAMLIPAIFEPFHGPHGRPSDGLGLGLFIVSEVVRAHGGTIAVRSTANEGTSFTIHLPRQRNSSSSGS